MIKTSEEIEAAFINSVKAITGKTLHQWLVLIEKQHITDRKRLVCMLQEKHGLNYLCAQLLSGIYFNKGIPVYKNHTKTQLK